LAQHALVQAADASHFSAEQPTAAQQAQSAHDVQSHNGQSGGQQQQPAASATGASALFAAVPIDSPVNIITITRAAAASAA
jgi:hypothetical protein